MKKELQNNGYVALKHEIGLLLEKGRLQAGRAINTILLQTYWQIGHHIVEFEQKGKSKAEFGIELLDRLSNDLALEYVKGFSRSNVFLMRKFYLTFPKSQTVSDQLIISETLSQKLSFEVIKI